MCICPHEKYNWKNPVVQNIRKKNSSNWGFQRRLSRLRLKWASRGAFPRFWNIRKLCIVSLFVSLAAPTLTLRDSVVSAIPGNILWCFATGTPPIYTALLRNNRLLVNSTRPVGIRLYLEYNYTCVATSKYGTDVRKHLIVFVGEALSSDLHDSKYFYF